MRILSNKKIFLYDQDRELLIFLLLIKFLKDEITYIAYDCYHKKLDNLRGNKIIINESSTKAKIKILNRFKMLFYIKKFRKENKDIIKKINDNEAELYGINFLQLGTRFFYKENLYLIEEGTGTYVKNNLKNRNKQILLNIFNKIFLLKERINDYTADKNIKKAYLTKNLCNEIPKGLEKKAEIINLKELWNKKSEEEKKIILNVFDFNPEILKKVNENTVMLFTQPLSEDNVISEKEKIELYSKILKKYENQSVIIKPHPREKTDYSIYFSNCYVMKEKYPVEILELVGINIKKVITIFSTAAFGLGKDVEIDFYGTEIHPKLFKRFGSQDKVMKRNAFLN